MGDNPVGPRSTAIDSQRTEYCIEERRRRVTHTVLERSAEFARPATSAKSRRAWATPILLQIAAVIGIGALLYSSAADWFATLGHNAEVSGYVEAVDQLPDEDRLDALRVAREYNSHMPQGVLRDPYSQIANDPADAAAYASYEQVLRVSDNGVIGELRYPRLGIGLPVYHGTSDEVISKGAGHLYGSSLPVGGPSTHTVLTAHSGLVHASLFTPLPGAKLGDTFQITVLGETHYYRVDSIETVQPDHTGALRIVNGKDYVTLITCTPIGINSHRVLVRGERIANPDTAGTQVVAGDGRTAGFPWWAVGFLGGSAAVAYVLFAPQRTPGPRKRASRRAAGARTRGTRGAGGQQ